MSFHAPAMCTDSGTLPAGEEILGQVDVELIEYAVNGLVDNVVQRLRTMVERGHRRHDHSPQLSSLRHLAQMAQVQRRFPHAQHQRTPLLQHHIRRTRHQGVGIAVHNAGERFN